MKDVRRIYADAEPLPLPYKAEFGFVLQEAHGFCPVCGEELEHMKGKINEYGQCIEVRMMGLCHKCKLLIECHPMRHYSDGRFMMRHEEHGWVELYSRHPSVSKTMLVGLGTIVILVILAILLL